MLAASLRSFIRLFFFRHSEIDIFGLALLGAKLDIPMFHVVKKFWVYLSGVIWFWFPIFFFFFSFLISLLGFFCMINFTWCSIAAFFPLCCVFRDTQDRIWGALSLGCAFAADWMGLGEGAFISSRGIRWGPDFLLESLPACLNLRMKSAQPVRSRPPVCGRRGNAPGVVNPRSGKRKYIYILFLWWQSRIVTLLWGWFGLGGLERAWVRGWGLVGAGQEGLDESHLSNIFFYFSVLFYWTFFFFWDSSPFTGTETL